MRALVYGLALLLIGTSAAFASPAKDASIRKLLVVMHARKLTRLLADRMEAMVDKSMGAELNGKTSNPETQEAVNDAKSLVHALLAKYLAWDKVQANDLRLYKATYSEEEIQGMISFYSSPVGRAVIDKGPLVIRKVMAYMQRRMRASAPKFRQIMRQFDADMEKANHLTFN